MLTFLIPTPHLPNKQHKDALNIPFISLWVIEPQMRHAARKIEILRLLHSLSTLRTKPLHFTESFDFSFDNENLLRLAEEAVFLVFVVQYSPFIAAGIGCEAFELGIDKA